ncbi:MAG: penicillin-insensitive murein endopeptidase, partial [Polyangiaceae bacterium]
MRQTGATLLLLALTGCASVGPSPGGPASPSAECGGAPCGASDTSSAPLPDAPDIEVEVVAAPMADPAEELAVAAELGGRSEETAIHAGEEHDHAIEDDLPDLPPAPPVTGDEPPRAVSPLFALSDAEVSRRVRQDIDSLGPLSVGIGGKGVLVNGQQMEDGPYWKVMEPSLAYGTAETIDYLQRAITTVNRQFPTDTHEMLVGHLSAKKGGHLRSHKSHQSGRDVDLSYYYLPDSKWRWYQRAHAGNLDVARSWAFVRSLLVETDVMFIFINTSVQRLLKAHALSIGEDPEWLDDVFEWDSKSPWPIVRHSPGHDTHIHVRFYNPVAQEMGRRAYGTLVASGRIKPPTFYTYYKVKKGDILGRVAKKFDVSVRDIQKANGLRSTTIMAGKTYRIPRKG